jgi:hypothetical protein
MVVAAEVKEEIVPRRMYACCELMIFLSEVFIRVAKIRHLLIVLVKFFIQDYREFLLIIL